jgi:hypothetical protein
MSKSPLLLAALTMAAACGESSTPLTHALSGAPSASEPGQSVLALVHAPASVHCLKLAITTADRVRQERYTLTPGATVPVTITGLDAGPVSITGTAHDVACAQASRSNATWQTEPLALDIRVSQPNDIELVLHPVRPAQVDVSFRPDLERIHVSDGLVAAWDRAGKLYWNLDEGWYEDGTALFGLETLEIQDIAGSNSGTLCAAHSQGVDCVGQNDGIVDPEADQGEVYSAPRRVVSGDFVQVAIGSFAACARRRDQAIVCWGLNQNRLIDDDPGVWKATPRETSYGIDMHLTQAALCILDAEGDVECRGNNLFKGLGVPGDTHDAYGVAAAIVDVSGTGNNTSYALRADGQVIAWGSAASGALGNGISNASTSAASLPAAIPGLTDIVAIAGGYDTGCALDAEGALWCWGDELPDGTGQGQTTPQRFEVAGAPLVALSGGFHAMCGLHADGAVSCWGYQTAELLGDGSISHFVPAEVQSWSTRP